MPGTALRDPCHDLGPRRRDPLKAARHPSAKLPPNAQLWAVQEVRCKSSQSKNNSDQGPWLTGHCAPFRSALQPHLPPVPATHSTDGRTARGGPSTACPVCHTPDLGLCCPCGLEHRPHPPDLAGALVPGFGRRARRVHPVPGPAPRAGQTEAPTGSFCIITHRGTCPQGQPNTEAPGFHCGGRGKPRGGSDTSAVPRRSQRDSFPSGDLEAGLSCREALWNPERMGAPCPGLPQPPCTHNSQSGLDAVPICLQRWL